MKRIFAVLALVIGLAVPAVAGSIATAGPASAVVCTDWTSAYKFKDKAEVLKPTDVAGNWVWPNNGTFSWIYNQTASYTNSWAVSVGFGVEADLVLVKASSSIGLTVGRSWSQSKSWTYTATVAKDPAHDYRIHLYHYGWSFNVMKVDSRVCNGQVQSVNDWSSWRSVYHAPVESASANLWAIDKRPHP